MPLVGLKNESGTIRKRFEDIDIAKDYEWLKPADPALIAFVISQANERSDVSSDEVSASQLETGTRALWLQETTDYYETVTGSIASIMGTMKHSMVNVERPGFIMETRLFGPYGSAKCDSFFVPLSLLADLKNVKWYKIKMMLERGVVSEAKGYAYQVNLFRILMKMPENQQLLLEKYDWLREEDLVVKKMQLTCVPPDMNYMTKKEAQKLVSDTTVIPIDVPFLKDDVVLDAYARKLDEKLAALAKNYAPLCSPEDRWERNGFPVKCKSYCAVAEACQQVSKLVGERHPLDGVRQSKEAA
jgi:hypothetical protein